MMMAAMWRIAPTRRDCLRLMVRMEEWSGGEGMTVAARKISARPISVTVGTGFHEHARKKLTLNRQAAPAKKA